MTSGETQTFCRICIAQCGVLVTHDETTVVSVRGDGAHPLSRGYTCAKGRSLPALHHSPRRLDVPLMRARVGKPLKAVTWDEAVSDIAGRMASAIDAVGPRSVALFIGNGGSMDPAGRRAALKLVRGLGSDSVYSVATVDAPSKPVVAELVSGNSALISGAPDVETTALTLLVGTNPVTSHGHTSAWTNPRSRLRRLQSNGEVWVVDPRRTETARLATRHLQPRVGTDHYWLAAVVRELLTDGTGPAPGVPFDGLDELTRAVEPWTVDAASAVCDLDPRDLLDLVASVRRYGRIAVQTGTGVSMTAQAPVTEWLSWVLMVLTDSVDQPGGLFFNPGLLHGLDRRRFPAGDGHAEPGPPCRPELPHRLGEHASVALPDEIDAGHVRVLVAFGGNLMTALPGGSRLRSSLERLDALVSVDVVENATSEVATHVLPALGQLERADLPYLTDCYNPVPITQYTPRVVEPGGQRRAGWRIFVDIARRLGSAPQTWVDAAAGADPDLWSDDDFLRPLLAGGPLTLAELQRHEGPIREPTTYGWVRAGVAANGGWRLAPAALVARLTADPGTVSQALVLAPRRQLRQMNSQLTRSGTSDGITESADVHVHPDDAARLDVRDGEWVEVASPAGRLTLVLRTNPDVARGTASFPHGHDLIVNDLTRRESADPLTGMPVFAGVELRIEPTVARPQPDPHPAVMGGDG